MTNSCYVTRNKKPTRLAIAGVFMLVIYIKFRKIFRRPARLPTIPYAIVAAPLAFPQCPTRASTPGFIENEWEADAPLCPPRCSVNAPLRYFDGKRHSDVSSAPSQVGQKV